MEKVSVRYLLKNFPAPNERTFQLQLIEKIQLFIKKLRSKAFFFINNGKEITESCASHSVYGLKSNKCHPQIKELIRFEDDLIDLVKNLKFRKVRNHFQMKLTKTYGECVHRKKHWLFLVEYQICIGLKKNNMVTCYKKRVNDNI